MRLLLALMLLTFATAEAQHSRDREIRNETADPDTLAWWHTTEALSGDDLQGRDTGTAAYQRAADYVASRFKAAGLTPAGDHATFFQSVPMHQLDVTSATFTVNRKDGSKLPLTFLTDITITPNPDKRMVTGPLTFRGFCGKDAMADIKGKIVLCFGTQRKGLSSGAERTKNAIAGGAIALVTVDDPGFTIEPPRWPYAYARTVTLFETLNGRVFAPITSIRLSAASFAAVIQGSGRDAAEILKAGGNQQPLASFDIPSAFSAHWQTAEKNIASPNVLATLPGTDPVLKNEYIVIAAHLDGYGFGTPVAGDNLYNGTLDDAAYVALLIQFADNLHRDHTALKRSIFFCAFTGEEKGLLGSNYFVDHPTIAKESLAADINLDQLRPLFPLHILTALAIDDTSLGALATQVAAAMNIELRADHEPERGLLRRADHYPFLRIGVPAIGFIFGYDSGTDAEKRYREWYQIRYHRPQDDLTQPVDFAAAATFDQFFYRLTTTLANTPTRPVIYPASPFAPK